MQQLYSSKLYFWIKIILNTILRVCYLYLFLIPFVSHRFCYVIPNILLNFCPISLMNKRMDMQRETNYHMGYSEDLAIPGVSNPVDAQIWCAVLADKDQWGLSYLLYYRGSCTPTCAEHNFWAIRPQPGCLGWPAGFVSTCFYSSKPYIRELLN